MTLFRADVRISKRGQTKEDRDKKESRREGIADAHSVRNVSLLRVSFTGRDAMLMSLKKMRHCPVN